MGPIVGVSQSHVSFMWAPKKVVVWKLRIIDLYDSNHNPVFCFNQHVMVLTLMFVWNVNLTGKWGGKF